MQKVIKRPYFNTIFLKHLNRLDLNHLQTFETLGRIKTFFYSIIHMKVPTQSVKTSVFRLGVAYSAHNFRVMIKQKYVIQAQMYFESIGQSFFNN